MRRSRSCLLYTSISDAGLITDPAVTGGAGAALLNAALVLALSTALVYAMHLPVTGLTFACLFMMAGFSPVSYTHLDVYKRQPKTRE